jgi:outer membrane protein assembly factor BamD (BamD/ComL family)
MRTSTFTRILPLLIIIAALLGACASQSEEIPEDLEPIEYFQRAQKIASEDENYVLAKRYYKIFLERYPEDIQRIVEAKYEIAYLSYKQGNYELARQQFEEMLSYYEDEGSRVLPRWPQVLAEKVLDKMSTDPEQKQAAPTQTMPAQPQPQ